MKKKISVLVMSLLLLTACSNLSLPSEEEIESLQAVTETYQTGIKNEAGVLESGPSEDMTARDPLSSEQETGQYNTATDTASRGFDTADNSARDITISYVSPLQGLGNGYSFVLRSMEDVKTLPANVAVLAEQYLQSLEKSDFFIERALFGYYNGTWQENIPLICNGFHVDDECLVLEAEMQGKSGTVYYEDEQSVVRGAFVFLALPREVATLVSEVRAELRVTVDGTDPMEAYKNAWGLSEDTKQVGDVLISVEAIQRGELETPITSVGELETYYRWLNETCPVDTEYTSAVRRFLSECDENFFAETVICPAHVTSRRGNFRLYPLGIQVREGRAFLYCLDNLENGDLTGMTPFGDRYMVKLPRTVYSEGMKVYSKVVKTYNWLLQE